MKHAAATVLMVCLGAVATFSAPAQASSQQDFESVYAAAEAANAEALKIENAWSPTTAALKAAKEAAAAKDFDKAVTLAKNAEALAKLSIEQAKEEDQLWQDAVIR